MSKFENIKIRNYAELTNILMQANKSGLIAFSLLLKDMFENEKVAYVMDLHNGDELDVYFASVLGRLRHADGSYEYVHIQEMEDHLNRIFAE